MPPRPVPHVQTLIPYEWEASAAEVAAAAGIAESAVIHFDTNTTAWPPVSWEATTVDLPRVAANEYPHPSNEPLRSALAKHLSVAPDQVVVTCGADEAIALVARAYLGAGRFALAADPSFAMFRVSTEAVGGNVVPVPVDEQFDLPQGPVVEAVANPEVTVAWLCSPNNPTGRLVAPSLVEAAAEAAPDTIIVVDEAYHEISGTTLLPLLERYPNLVFIRTFSKGYGLAGARVGYAVARPDVARVLDTVRPPQNLTMFGILAAGHALADQAGLSQRVASIVQQRARLADALSARGWEIVPSSANFLLTRPPLPALELLDWLKGDGLILRSFPSQPRLREWLRVTVRSPEENDRFLARVDAAQD